MPSRKLNRRFSQRPVPKLTTDEMQRFVALMRLPDVAATLMYNVALAGGEAPSDAGLSGVSVEAAQPKKVRSRTNREIADILAKAKDLHSRGVRWEDIAAQFGVGVTTLWVWRKRAKES